MHKSTLNYRITKALIFVVVMTIFASLNAIASPSWCDSVKVSYHRISVDSCNFEIYLQVPQSGLSTIKTIRVFDMTNNTDCGNWQPNLWGFITFPNPGTHYLRFILYNGKDTIVCEKDCKLSCLSCCDSLSIQTEKLDKCCFAYKAIGLDSTKCQITNFEVIYQSNGIIGGLNPLSGKLCFDGSGVHNIMFRYTFADSNYCTKYLTFICDDTSTCCDAIKIKAIALKDSCCFMFVIENADSLKCPIKQATIYDKTTGNEYPYYGYNGGESICFKDKGDHNLEFVMKLGDDSTLCIKNITVSCGDTTDCCSAIELSPFVRVGECIRYAVKSSNDKCKVAKITMIDEDMQVGRIIPIFSPIEICPYNGINPRHFTFYLYNDAGELICKKEMYIKI
jgi:hypothetical protein